MSLRFYFGPSGSGKSRQLYQEMVERAGKEPDRNFFIIVPDQFTMETQKDLVVLSPRGGILNIDVLSFGRLSYRILEEVGRKETPILDDTGKSLVLQKVAAGLVEELPVLGSLLHKQGYIHEVKSAVSEFMQYGISTQDVFTLSEYAKKRGALSLKLRDLGVLYQGFSDYIRDRFITTEETLDVLRRSLKKSRLLPDSVVVFDGFTGFTPIQERVIQEMMGICREITVTVTMGAGENPYEQDGEQRLFHLSKKTVARLERLAKEALGGAGVERQRDVFLLPGEKAQPGEKVLSGEAAGRCQVMRNPHHRFCKAPALAALEKNLFRYRVEPYEEETLEIRLFESLTPRDEVRQAGLEIKRLIRETGMAYRDVAVITGDLEAYAPYVETEFEQMEIPCFIDKTNGIVLNPMIEYIKSALLLYLRDFSYEAVFHYLRSGLSDIPRQDIDELENYCIRTGLRGRRAYERRFTRKTEEMEGEEVLLRLNAIREQLMGQIGLLSLEKSGLAKTYVNHLYDFLVENKVQEKLAVYEAFFQKEGQLSKAREYAQIYRLVMELLDQIYGLLGEEEISLQEFYDILEAGFLEIQVGTIPQNVDRVVAGDMERTRLKQVKALFFLGVNDGNIPKSASKGGIISDMDREFLQESNLELAPTPRQQMYIQRLYLYLNLTKPSHRLYLSYAKVNSQGKSLRPAYLIDVVKRLFPRLSTEYPQNRSVLEQIVTRKEGMGYLAQGLREYVQGSLSEKQQTEFFTIYQAYGEEEVRGERALLTQAAFKRYQETGLSAAVARALYGKNLENSVTRLETYAACACRHFLQYGLSLKEREEFSFENTDMGTVYHGVLESFAHRLQESPYTWFDFPEEFGREAVHGALESLAAVYGDTVLYSSARNEYAITRMERILTRTVLTLQSQLKKGSFLPDVYEVSFHFADKLESVNVALSQEEKMRLQGRIDRIDVAQEADKVYVKVIDYKSGSRQFDLAALYYGLQLQLVVYMNAAMELEAKKHPDKEIVPAALLYYHIEDPTVETATELTQEEINQQLLEKLRMNGVVNSQPDIVERLDRYMQDRSDVIPVEKKKDGSFSSRSSVMSTKELKVLSDYVNHKIKRIGQEILDGSIGLSPYELGTRQACSYCPYKRVCGFDPAIPGCNRRVLENLDQEQALLRMEEEAYGNHVYATTTKSDRS
ncbi:MAG TPA: exodeoxyribonuclease V subunit gamma [Candidatus Acetatifactor stercoripullorum]|uniref:Exodeoxyribonuclease V subunit gamma n=1 Tax=Candidatus Acetatifactor stercoripullorum TaxID=2838414 RepID=A0A9D1UBW7_9FIRM|nr:PD-(D/E)XK nuclease family protein [uncultured Acetatifactor sp.]HIW82137.1 exodeoxyribonuclease V subunit gamma [Candidatus Acetatifactor stercoripullorum]